MTKVSGITYLMKPNDQGINSIAFNFEATPVMITITNKFGDQTFGSGFGTMVTG